MSYPTQVKCAESETVIYSHSQTCKIKYSELFTPKAIFDAYLRARKTKRKKGYIFNFELSLMANLEDLRLSLVNHTYKPIPCRVFNIWCNAGHKIRVINAPDFRDLIAQFVFYDAVYSYFDKGYIFDSYGCRKGKGALKAANRTQEFIRQSPKDSYYLQIDIRKYYYSIDHKILKQSLQRRIQDQDLVNLAMQFCENDSNVGINVGSLVAQLFGQIYLDRFDHYVKRVLKIKHYVRYVDDMVFIGLSYEDAKSLLATVQQYLHKNLHLTLSKWLIRPLSKGINFAGLRTWHSHRFIRKRSLHTFSKRLKSKDYQALESVLAHAQYSSSYKHLMTRLQTESTYSQLPKHLQRRLDKWQFTHTLQK